MVAPLNMVNGIKRKRGETMIIVKYVDYFGELHRVTINPDMISMIDKDLNDEQIITYAIQKVKEQHRGVDMVIGVEIISY